MKGGLACNGLFKYDGLLGPSYCPVVPVQFLTHKTALPSRPDDQNRGGCG